MRISDWSSDVCSSDLVTLALGLVIAWGCHHRTLLSSTMALVSAAIACVLNDPLMFGFYGALVPASLLMVINKPAVFWLLPASLCLLIKDRKSTRLNSSH